MSASVRAYPYMCSLLNVTPHTDDVVSFGYLHVNTGNHKVYTNLNSVLLFISLLRPHFTTFLRSQVAIEIFESLLFERPEIVAAMIGLGSAYALTVC
jgi:hypothetical protein